ncbi:MAG: hypothetical protein WD098_04945 [Balneolales bacterium]
MTPDLPTSQRTALNAQRSCFHHPKSVILPTTNHHHHPLTFPHHLLMNLLTNLAVLYKSKIHQKEIHGRLDHPGHYGHWHHHDVYRPHRHLPDRFTC